MQGRSLEILYRKFYRTEIDDNFIFFVTIKKNTMSVEKKKLVVSLKSLSGARKTTSNDVIDLKNARQFKRTRKYEETCCIFPFQTFRANNNNNTSLCVT